MWSVWSNPTQLYFGAGLVMLKRPRHADVVLEHPITWSWGKTLNELARVAALKPGTHRLPKRPLTVHLSAVWAPALYLGVPAALTRFADRQAYLAQAVASALQAKAGDLIIEQSDAHEGLVASMPRHLKTVLCTWASGHGLRVGAIAPLWSAITRSKCVRQQQIKALVLEEPGCTTFLHPHGKHVSAQTWVDGVNLDQTDVHRQIRRFMVSDGLTEGEVARWGFAKGGTSAAQGLPSVWPGHWSDCADR